MSDSLDLTLNRIREFVSARDWSSFHSPKNLTMALAGEVGELVAEFQWLSAEASERMDADASDPELAGRVASEIADVAIYLILLADRFDVDLIDAVHQKLQLNETRFPSQSEG